MDCLIIWLVSSFDKDGKVTEATLKQLQPFLDMTSSIVRVGGRLSCAILPEETRNPPILPAKNRYVERYVLALHESQMHAGPATLLVLIRTKMWLLQGPQEVKRIIRHCDCYRF